MSMFLRTIKGLSLTSVLLASTMSSVAVAQSIELNRSQFNEVASKNFNLKYYDMVGSDRSPSPLDVNQYPVDAILCDPITGEKAPSLQHGVAGSLYIKDSDRLYGHFQNVKESLTLSNMSQQKLFFSDMNIPTTKAKVGFSVGDGTFISDDQGNRLEEDYGIVFNTILKLTDSQSEDDYELSLFSDDGAILEVFVDNKWVEIINNDNQHATKMGCAKNTVHLTKETALPVRVKYFQAKKNYIANVLMWRIALPKVEPTPPKMHSGLNFVEYLNLLRRYQAGRAQKMSFCGVSGTGVFYNVEHPERKTLIMNTLIAQGWSVVPKGNLYLPRDKVYNPCVDTKIKPVISDIYLQYALQNGGVISFQTDIPSSVYLRIVNVATGEIIDTQSDNLLRTNFYIGFFDLLPNTQYSVQIVATSESGGRTVSEPILVTTTP